MIVAEMEARMPNHEFVKWAVYYGRQAQAAELERLKAGQ
jgi:hypothetical protein